MAYLVSGMTIFILALGLGTAALQVQNTYGNGNMRDSRFLTRREAPPTYQHYAAEIQLLKNIIAVLESKSSNQEAYAQQSNAQRFQQMLASTYKGLVQGQSRYDEEVEMQPAAEKLYDRLQVIAASGRPGSGGGGSFGGGR